MHFLNCKCFYSILTGFQNVHRVCFLQISKQTYCRLDTYVMDNVYICNLAIRVYLILKLLYPRLSLIQLLFYVFFTIQAYSKHCDIQYKIKDPNKFFPYLGSNQAARLGRRTLFYCTNKIICVDKLIYIQHWIITFLKKITGTLALLP